MNARRFLHHLHARKAGIGLAARAALLVLCMSPGAVAQIIWKVDPSATNGNGSGQVWPNAFLSLDAALRNPNLLDGHIILVAEGLYRPGESIGSTARAESFGIQKAISIYGGYLGLAATGTPSSAPNAPDGDMRNTILSGDMLNTPTDSSDNSYHVVKIAANLPGTVVLDGLTITGGFADGASPSQQNGGGIVGNQCTLEVSDCEIVQNHAMGYGGGIAIDGHSASPPGISIFRMKRCVVKRNSAGTDGGGGSFNGDVGVTVFNTRFSYNGAGNFGGGIRFTSKVFPNVSSGVGSFLLANSVMHDNRALAGGGVSLDHKGVNTTRRDILNCTIAFNTAGLWSSVDTHCGVTPGGSGIDVSEINATLNGGYFVNINNSIVVLNPDIAGPNGTGPDNVFSWSPQLIIVDRCDLGDDATCAGIVRTNSLNTPPLFKNGLARRLRLTALSPCLEAGDDALLPIDSLDVDEDLSLLEVLDVDFSFGSGGPTPYGRQQLTTIPQGLLPGNDTAPFGKIVDIGAYDHTYLGGI